MAWANSTKFKSRGDALSRANARHVCLDCRYHQPKIYKECPQCSSKNRQYFMSESEHHRGMLLMTKLNAGTISDLVFQPIFPLHVNGVKIGKYVADYSYTENGIKVVEDRKGSAKHIEPLSKWKMLHFKTEYGQSVKITSDK